ncbi:MAG: hypothetical protein QME35_04955 [Thermoanaerobacteraceae bacterium]|nr:hypothetical protein [Thermoanaerobacteraceae bacterium]
MQYIKNILNSTKKELKYQFYSNVFFIMLLTMFLFSVLNLYNQMTNVKNNYNLFLHTQTEEKKIGNNIEKELNSPVDIKKENGLEIINNPLKFDYDNVALSIYDLKKPDRIITNTLKYLSFFFYSFFFTIYGIYISTYDIKFKTIKVKAVQRNWNQILFSKQLSIFVSSFIIILIVLLLSNIVGSLFYYILSHQIPVNDFKLSVLPSDTNVVLQFILSISISFIFSTIGFYLGLIFRGFMYPAVIFIVYDFILPVIGKYDLRNLISVLGHKVFDFYGNFILFKPIEVPTNIVIIILTSFVILSTIFIYIITEKQSKYIY